MTFDFEDDSVNFPQETEETLKAQKICVTCKHLIGVRHRQELWKSWKCGSKNNLIAFNLNPVSGLNEPVYNFPTCEIARNVGEGCKGNWWEEYIAPQPSVQSVTPPKQKKLSYSSISADDL